MHIVRGYTTAEQRPVASKHTRVELFIVTEYDINRGQIPFCSAVGLARIHGAQI